MALQNLPRLEFLVRKQAIWQPCGEERLSVFLCFNCKKAEAKGLMGFS
jgi:hypothetical protein